MIQILNKDNLKCGSHGSAHAVRCPYNLCTTLLSALQKYSRENGTRNMLDWPQH